VQFAGHLQAHGQRVTGAAQGHGRRGLDRQEILVADFVLQIHRTPPRRLHQLLDDRRVLACRTGAERQRLLSELARVSRRYVVLSYYQFNWLHACSCLLRWRKKRRVPTILSETDLDTLARANGLERLSTCALLRYGHMQTFSILEKKKINARIIASDVSSDQKMRF
jgi:hypothetical protein